VNFAFSEEQEELRGIVRAFLNDKSSEATVRELMETIDGYDPAVWSQMAEQMGLQALVIPEEFGGQGYGFVELVVVLEEMGRRLLCAPYFATVVLGAQTLIHSGDTAAQQDYLPGIASGETIATLAYTEPNGKWDESAVTMTASRDGDVWKLSGTKLYVLDGHTAGLIITAARTDAGVSLFAVSGDADGLTRTALSTMDQTRKQARLEYADVEGRLIGVDGEGWAAIERVLDLAAVPSRSAERRKCSTRRSSTPRIGCNSVDRSVRSRPSSTSVPTCCSRSSRRNRRRTTPAGAPRS